MWRTSAMRIVQAVPLLFIVSALTFFLQLFIPGDAARAIGGLQASPQAIAALRHHLHLDAPVWVRYWDWLKGAVHGNLGQSIINNESVTGELNQRLGVTLSVVIAATLFSMDKIMYARPGLAGINLSQANLNPDLTNLYNAS